LCYQPQLHLNSYAPVAREALLRWSHPQFSDTTPTQFVPLLEETGLIVPVGEWVLRTACLDEMIRQQSGLAPQRVAVNLSIRQFRQRDFVDMVAGILKETGLAPKYLELEVTEGLLINNITETARTLHELHDLGVMLSIDDFGTGYSSMNYLKRLPFDCLKIDRSFVHDITHNTDDAAIASAIITLAHSMDLQVVAEGVENVEQLVYLHARGCDIVQGYLLSRPVAFENMAAFDRIGARLQHYLSSRSK
jgi:EAL domain-containing protein (putative c-di-GMP-specific phosphodiesterase class I)